MLVLIPLLPLLAGLSIVLSRNRISSRAAAATALGGAAGALLVSIVVARPFPAVRAVIGDPAVSLPLRAWLAAGPTDAAAGLQWQPWSLTAALVVTGLLLVVHGWVDGSTRHSPAPEVARLHASLSLLGAGALLIAIAGGLPALIAGGQVGVLAAGLLATSSAIRTTTAGVAAVEWVREAWHAVDDVTLDGVVRSVAHVVLGWSAILRRAQSGSVRAYAASLLAGIVGILGYLLWRR